MSNGVPSNPAGSADGDAAKRGLGGRVSAWRDRRRRRRARTEQHVEPGLADTSLGQFAVTYEPCVDGDPDPGEIVWAWVPYAEDHTRGKDRPVVIIGRQGPALAGVQLTTKGAGHPDNVFVGTGEWDPQRRDSWAKLDRIVQIEPATVRRVDIALDRDRFREIVAALLEHHGVNLRTS